MLWEFSTLWLQGFNSLFPWHTIPCIFKPIRVFLIFLAIKKDYPSVIKRESLTFLFSLCCYILEVGNFFFKLFFFSFFLFIAEPAAWNQSCSCRPISQPHGIWATSVTYTAACGNTRSLTHWARPGIEPASLQTLCQVLNPLSHNRNSQSISYSSKTKRLIEKLMLIF